MSEDEIVFQKTEIMIEESELSVALPVQKMYSTFDKYELYYSEEDLKLIKEYIDK